MKGNKQMQQTRHASSIALHMGGDLMAFASTNWKTKNRERQRKERLEEEMKKDALFWSEAFWSSSEKSGSAERRDWRRQQCLSALTLHPLFPLALLFVLLLEFVYHSRVHIPGLRNGTLLVLVYTGEQKPDREAVEELHGRREDELEMQASLRPRGFTELVGFKQLD